MRRLLIAGLLVGCAPATPWVNPYPLSPEAQRAADLLDAAGKCSEAKRELAVSRGTPDERAVADRVDRWCGEKMRILREMKPGH